VGLEKLHGLALSRWSLYFSGEHPVMGTDGGEVAGLHPANAFIRVPSFGPAPERLKDRMVDRLKDLGADAMPVILRPASNEGVEETDQRPGSGALVGFDDASDFAQERLDALQGGLNEQLPVVFTQVLAEVVSPFLNGSDHGLLGREFEAPFVQECLDDGFHFLFQQLLGRTGDQQIISEANHVDFGGGSFPFIPHVAREH
jgi:hypothetical protein